MDILEWVKTWGWLLNLVVAGLGAWVLWSLRQAYVPRKDCKANHDKVEKDCQEHRDACGKACSKRSECVDSRLVEVERRGTELTEALKHLPSVQELQQISLRMERVGGDIRALEVNVLSLKELVIRIERPLDLLVEHHMQEGVKR